MTTQTEQWIVNWRNFLTNHPQLNNTGFETNLKVPKASPEDLAENETFWEVVQSCYPTSENLINLNNGGVSSSPLVVERAYTSYYRLVNSSPSYYIFKEMEQGREIVREGLSTLLNCTKDEIAILRNATEALNNAIFGIELQSGDEVVACKQDYSKAISSWKQRELRDHINVVWVEIDGTETHDEVISKYISAFSAKTKVLHLTHVINWNGQLLPVEAITREAKKRNIQVILDAAHSFGILDIDVRKIDCDYLATALHKWLSGPIPSGMLYVKKERIAKTWPLASSSNPRSDNVRKFEELSIQLLPNIISLGYAIEFHSLLGRAVKEHRVRHLRKYWTNAVKNTKQIKFNTPLNESQCVIIVNISLEGWEPVALENELFQNHGIHVTSVLWENMQGIRITPNIYTSKTSLMKLVDALKQIADK